MKIRNLSLALAALFMSMAALAVPAKPGAIKYTQPDGSVILLERHGDEFFHWTTKAGFRTPVTLGPDGFWRETTMDDSSRRKAAQARNKANQERIDMARATHNNDPMTHGERHIPVLLVSFSDKDFTIEDPVGRFGALLNDVDYSIGGGTGSVRDYYMDNSHGAFIPVFDVYGPVTLTKEASYYGANNNGKDVRPSAAILEAAGLLNDVIDYSQYDYDKDGYVDMMLMYYAGYNEAEGGPEDSIWPHQSGIFGAKNYDGLGLGYYFCTSELKDSKGGKMCGIGTTCHEFGHSLGMPDFYDTDYDENGKTHALAHFSLMCSGSYNNEGRTPPYLNAEERMYLGWMSDDDIITLPEGKTSFGSVRDDIAYRTYTDTEGEYFLYECRDGKGWDKPLPTGLLIYHVDKSSSRKVNGTTPYSLWYDWRRYNSLNAYADHPCFYLIPSSSPSTLKYSGSETGIIFPGTVNAHSYTPIDWEGRNTGYTIDDIFFTDDKVSLNMSSSVTRVVKGSVQDSQGKALPGVYVLMTKPAVASARGFHIFRSASNKVYETVSEEDGTFQIPIDDYEASVAHLAFSKSGYKTIGKDINVGPRGATLYDVEMRRVSEGDKYEFSYFDPSNTGYVVGMDTKSAMASIRIPAKDLPQNGGTVMSVVIPPLWKADAYYVLVDSGSERLLWYKVPGMGRAERPGNIPVDLSNKNVVFTSEHDLYVGFAVENAAASISQYENYLFFVSPTGNNCYLAKFDQSSTEWGESEEVALVLTANILGNADEQPEEKEIESFAEMGFISIYDPGCGKYHAGDTLPLTLVLPDGVFVLNASWKLDGTDVSDTESVTLNAGTHKLTAMASLSNGTIETLELTLVAE